MSFHYQRGRSAVIRNQRCGLVLDASEYQVKLQHFTGFASQLWILELLDNGKFVIINKGNWKVLDIQGGAQNGNNLITHNRHSSINQQWFIDSDNTIVNASDNLAIDLPHERPGGNVIVYKKHGGPNQQFHFQYQ